MLYLIVKAVLKYVVIHQQYIMLLQKRTVPCFKNWGGLTQGVHLGVAGWAFPFLFIEGDRGRAGMTIR